MSVIRARRRAWLSTLAVASLLAWSVLLTAGTMPANADHRTYCGHEHSGGRSHGVSFGYFWMLFLRHDSSGNFHRYVDIFHDNRTGKNYRVRKFWKQCHFGTPTRQPAIVVGITPALGA
jgi:hypothetical protein